MTSMQPIQHTVIACLFSWLVGCLTTLPVGAQGLDGLDAMESIQSSGVTFLGDRVFYTFARDGDVGFFGRARVRPGNLSLQENPQWSGLTERSAQMEGGLASVLVSPVGLWSARLSTDSSYASNGTELQLNWSTPLVSERWLTMGSLGLTWRSGSLTNYYFGGVSANEAAVARLPYDVGNSWSVVPSVVTSYRLNPQWQVGGVLSYEAFSANVRDNPLIQKAGRYDAMIGIGYVWK